MAKQLLAEATQVGLPEWRGTAGMPSPPTLRDAHGQAHTGRYVFRASRRATLHGAQTERAVGGIRPDVIAHDEIGPLLLEVRVTHRVDRLKQDAVRARRYRMVEIDLSKISFEDAVDATRFSELVLYELSNRHWVSLPDAEDEWRAAFADLQAEVARVDAAKHTLAAASVALSPDFVSEDPLRLPTARGGVVRASHREQLRSARLGSRIWHTGLGVGTLIRQETTSSPVYVCEFDSRGRHTIVLEAAGEGVRWAVLAEADDDADADHA